MAKGKWHTLSPKTKGYELDGVLVNLFGKGTIVYLYVNRQTKEFRATDSAQGIIPIGFELFSGGRVGDRGEFNDKTEIQDRPLGTTTGRFAVSNESGNSIGKEDTQRQSQFSQGTRSTQG